MVFGFHIDIHNDPMVVQGGTIVVFLVVSIINFSKHLLLALLQRGYEKLVTYLSHSFCATEGLLDHTEWLLEDISFEKEQAVLEII